MRYFVLTLFLSLSLTIFANEHLVVEQSTGETSWAISSIKDLTFDGKGVKFTFTDNTTIYYSAETLSLISFNGTISGIDAINAKQVIVVEGSYIVAEGNKNNIKVYSLNGTVVAQGIGEKLDISHLGNGTYIVQAGGLISKIVKQ